MIPWSWILALIIGYMYLILVRCLRYRNAGRHRQGFMKRSDFRLITASQASSILRSLAHLEFPLAYNISTGIGILHTYGIPSISKLLVATAQTSCPMRASKRMVDTELLLLELCFNDPYSSRSIEALARINNLHSKYHISNADMLYVLSVFMLQPPRYIERFEWRKCTHVELCAAGVLWKHIGDRMHIDFSELLPPSNSGPGKENNQSWADGLDFYNDLESWSDQYERQHMKPHRTNAQMSTAFIDFGCLLFPSFVRSLAIKLLACCFTPRLRTAVSIPAPDAFTSTAFETVLTVRRYIIRYLMLPRPKFMVDPVLDRGDPDAKGRYTALWFLNDPWYVRPSFWYTRGPMAWLSRCIGRNLPGDHGKRFHPEGYRILDLGPTVADADGLRDMNMDAESMAAGPRCPFG